MNVIKVFHIIKTIAEVISVVAPIIERSKSSNNPVPTVSNIEES